jgi:hypothetical protein
MQTSALVNEYLKDKQHLLTGNDSINIYENQIISWDFANIPQPTQEELDALVPVVEAKQSQEATKAEALAFLQSTDYKVLKYRDQVDMGVTPDLTVEEYQYLLEQRQQARDAIK